MAKGNFEKFGDWDLAGLFTGNLAKDIEASNKLALRQLGLRTERLVVKWIQRQPGSWPALNEKYLEQKRKQGYSTLMLRRTGSLINSINSYADNKEVAIGVKRDTRNSEGGDLVSIAAIMEYGSQAQNIPPRPYFSPAFKQIRREIIETKYFSAFLLQYLKKKYRI